MGIYIDLDTVSQVILKTILYTYIYHAYTCRCWAVSPEQPAGQKEQTGGEHGQREAPTAVAAQQSEALQLG